MSLDIHIKWLGHSCFLLNDEKCFILFDPFKNGSVPNLTFHPITVNYLFISHEHDDHNNRSDVSLFLNKIEDIKYETITIPHDEDLGLKRGLNKIHIIYFNNYKIAHLGDIGCMLNNEQINKLNNCDIIFIPINGFYTIGYEKAYEIFKILKPKLMIPMHYFYNNSGYQDNGQIKKLIDISKDNVLFCKDKEFNLDDFYNKNESKILILDSKNLNV